MSTEEYKGRLFIFSGPSGSGKDTILNELTKINNNVWVSVSKATRNKRDMETDGVDYLFTSVDSFRKSIEENDFLEYAEYAGNFYGTPKAPVLQHIREGRYVVLKIDVQGAAKVKKLIPEVTRIFVMTDSLETLEKRLRGRSSDDEQAIQKRLKAAQYEIEAAKEYDYFIVNDSLDKAVRELNDLITGIAESNNK